MKEKEKALKVIITILLLLLIDQTVKAFIQILQPNMDICFAKITYVQNTGTAFGVGSNNLITVIATNLIVLCIIIKFIICQFNRIDNTTKLMLCIVLAGGISNLLDRIFRGFVVDYIAIRKLSSV